MNAKGDGAEDRKWIVISTPDGEVTVSPEIAEVLYRLIHENIELRDEVLYLREEVERVETDMALIRENFN